MHTAEENNPEFKMFIFKADHGTSTTQLIANSLAHRPTVFIQITFNTDFELAITLYYFNKHKLKTVASTTAYR